MLEHSELIEKTLVVIPAYNAEKTIVDTILDLKKVGIQNIVVCDDGSVDETVEKVISFPNIYLIKHEKNRGYGGNQKSLYSYAIENEFQYVVMLHGDHQYNPMLVPSLCWLMFSGGYDIVMGSRIIGGHPLKNGMPFYKYIANRGLTYFQNIVTGSKLSEYHSGLRAYKIEVLKEIPFDTFSNDFIFDNQLLLAAIKRKFKIGEISCQTKFNHLTSSISLKKGIKYGIGILRNTILYPFTK